MSPRLTSHSNGPLSITALQERSPTQLCCLQEQQGSPCQPRLCLSLHPPLRAIHDPEADTAARIKTAQRPPPPPLLLLLLRLLRLLRLLQLAQDELLLRDARARFSRYTPALENEGEFRY